MKPETERAAAPSDNLEPLPPVVQEAIDAYGRYYAEHHKLGMSVRDDMRYIASLAIRWAPERAASVDKLDSEQSLPTLTDVVLDAYTEICELFGRNSGTYDPTPGEVYAVQDNLNHILREVVQASLRTSCAMDLLKALEVTVTALDKIRCERRDVPWDQTGPAIEIGQTAIAKVRGKA